MPFAMFTQDYLLSRLHLLLEHDRDAKAAINIPAPMRKGYNAHTNNPLYDWK